MRTLIGEKNGLPFLISPDELLCIDGNRCAERIIEIAAALQQAGIDGIRLQCIKVDEDLSVISLNLLQNSMGGRLVALFADYARKHKKIFSVEVALDIARRIQNGDARNG